MKKFSNISGSKVPEKKIEEVQRSEEDILKMEVLSLMEKTLSIQTYGPIDRYLRAGNIKISNKEAFIEALVDLLKEKSAGKNTKILESLKNKTKDWEAIDNEIEEINNSIKLKQESFNNKLKIKSLYENYKLDKDILLRKIDESCSKITDKNVAKMNSVASEILSKEIADDKELFLQISEKFNNRFKQLHSSLK